MDQVRIGSFIAQLRREKGWTQEELGERTLCIEAHKAHYELKAIMQSTS